MHSYPQEFVLVCRQLGEAQQRCSAALAAQAAHIEALQAEVVRLRGAVVLRDTRLAMAHEALASARAAESGLPRRKAVARHIAALVERIGALSRGCLRWRLAAEGDATAAREWAREQTLRAEHGHAAAPTEVATDVEAQAPVDAPARALSRAPHDVSQAAPSDPWIAASLAAADLVICQTGCISHDDYWRVQDHCRRTGKPCILVDQPLAARGVGQAPTPIQAGTVAGPAVILRMTRPRRAAETGADAEGGGF